MTVMIAYRDSVLVGPKRVEAVTPSGLAIPLQKEYKNEGIVLSVGSGWKNKKGTHFDLAEVQVGDEVIFDRHAGMKFKLNGMDVILLRFGDILAVKEGEGDGE